MANKLAALWWLTVERYWPTMIGLIMFTVVLVHIVQASRQH